MNKSDLIRILAEEASINEVEAEKTVNVFFNSITEALTEGSRAELRGFGSFLVKSYSPYKGRNPRTGDPVQVKPKKLPVFKPGRELQAQVDYPGESRYQDILDKKLAKKR